MVIDMLAYLIWILLTLAGIGLSFHILRLDRPREVKVPVRKEPRN